MTTSETTLMNRALQKCGSPGILSSGGNSSRNNKLERIMQLAYTPVRDMLQRNYVWNFCQERRQIPESSTAPSWGFAHAYPLPDGTLRVNEIDIDYAWRVEGTSIVTDATAPLDVILTIRETDTTKFDALFTELFVAHLALEVVEELTQSNTKKQLIERDVVRLTKQAVSIDAKERTPDYARETSWVTERR